MSYFYSRFFEWSDIKNIIIDKTALEYIIPSMRQQNKMSSWIVTKYLLSLFGNWIRVKVCFSIEWESINSLILSNTRVLVSAVPLLIWIKELNSGRDFYMCSTPSLPSLASWLTSLTKATIWNSVPPSDDLIMNVSILLLVYIKITLVDTGYEVIHRSYREHYYLYHWPCPQSSEPFCLSSCHSLVSWCWPSPNSVGRSPLLSCLSELQQIGPFLSFQRGKCSW